MICTSCLTSTSTIYGPCNVADAPFRACRACTWEGKQCRIDVNSGLFVQAQQQSSLSQTLLPPSDSFSRASSATTNAFSLVEPTSYNSPATSVEQNPALSGEVDGRSFAADHEGARPAIFSAGAAQDHSAEEPSQQSSTELSTFARPATRPWEIEPSARDTSQLNGQPELVPGSGSYDNLFMPMNPASMLEAAAAFQGSHENHYTLINSDPAFHAIVSGNQGYVKPKSRSEPFGLGPPTTPATQPDYISNTFAPPYAPDVTGPASSAANQDPLDSGIDMGLRTFLSTKFIAENPDLGTYTSWECSIADCPDAKNGRVKMTLSQMDDHARTHHVGFSLVHSQRLLHDAGCGLTLSHWVRLWHDYKTFKETYGDIEAIYDLVRDKPVQRGYRSWWSCPEMYTRDVLKEARNRIQDEKLAAKLKAAIEEEVAAEREPARSTAAQASQDSQRLERQADFARHEGPVMKIAAKRRNADETEAPTKKRKADEAEVQSFF